MTGESNMNEGVFLALSALSETMGKLEGYFAKAEELEVQKSEAELKKAEEILKSDEQALLIKSVTDAVVESLGLAKAGMVDGKTETSVSGGAQWPMASRPDDGDGETGAGETLSNPTSDAQHPIVAAHDGTEYKKEYPMEEEEKDKDTEMFKSMQETIAELKKQLDGMSDGKEAEIKKSNDDLVRKLGFREERSSAPRLAGRGITTGDVQIAKSADVEDVTAALSEIPYRQLREWEEQLKKGNTEGIPTELLANYNGQSVR